MIKRLSLPWMAMVSLIALAGCWRAGGDEQITPAQQLVEASQIRTLGENVCNIQLWAAESVNLIHGRDPDQANRDRVVWNLAQARMAAIFEAEPQISRTEAVQRVAEELRQLSPSAQLPGCAGPQSDSTTGRPQSPTEEEMSQTPYQVEQARVQALFEPQTESTPVPTEP